jgi:murein DD-endopeptidase MepM/ murein hydrolase activator NlpD
MMMLLLAPLSLVAASTPNDGAPGQDAASERSQAPPQAAPMTVDDWVRVLPAPPTPDGWAPAAGPRAAWPLRGTLTQPFGCTGFALEHPLQSCPAFHTGIDLAQPEGTPIRAADQGLAYPLADSARYGNYVLVQERAGYATVYGHMVRTNTSWGQPVQAGDVIGWVGTTGNSSGPHLHFEVRFGGAPQNPLPYLQGSPPDPYPVPEGWPGAPRDDWRGVR